VSDALRHFRHVWLVDFEFHQPDGERPEVLCLAAREYRSGQTIRVWANELAEMPAAPFPVEADCLFVAYYVSAELGCFESLGWPMPARILDLFAEFRCLTNGLAVPCGNGLLGALAYFGLGGMTAIEKQEMQSLAMRGGWYSEAERQALLDYCESDVLALDRLLPAMLPKIDLPRALLRGRYMAAAAKMETNGVPVDADALESLRTHWTGIKAELVAAVNADYGVYVPTGGRRFNPASTWGAAILDTAADWNIDPQRLAEAVDYVWQTECDAQAEVADAKQAARKATGLTVARINRWEDAGKDHASWIGLDDAARELAGELPALGIGRGYVGGENHDATNYAGRLWTMLREADEPRPKRTDRSILEQAAQLMATEPDEDRPPAQLSFSAERFAAWLIGQGIPWPRLESGGLALDDDTFRQMARTYPAVAPLRELRHSLGEMRLFSELAVGGDGRNRCLLSAFRSITSRNQPSNARFIFGPSTWARCLIKPERGRAVAYVDWSQQEFGIAAALSGDAAMQAAYTSADPYLTFAKQAGAVPPEATKQTHAREREQFKVCALAVQYGMGAKSLAQQLGQGEAYARQLLQLHRSTYPRFWQFSEDAVNHALLRGWLETVFGWRVYVGPRANARSLANFPMQANGAEMLRLACCLATERGIQVCAPVHDALLVEGPADEIESVVEATQAAMVEASELVLSGFALRSDAKIVRWPERYVDPRGERMWQIVMQLLARRADATQHQCGPQTSTSARLTQHQCGPVQSYSLSSNLF
jgi:hypothetical protein